MAIYSLHTAAVGRGQKKSSAVQAAAYQARESLYDRVTQETYYSSEKKYGKILDQGIAAPAGSPDWVYDRGELWNSAEEKDTRKNSRFAKSFILGLQDELTQEQNKNLLRKFVKKNFIDRGLVVDIAIHSPSEKGDKRNVHAHLLVSSRTMTPLGWGEKDRGIDRKDFLQGLRQSWEEEINKALKAAGRPERVSHKSLEAQGIARDQPRHMGAAATAILRKGGQPDRGKKQQVSMELVKEALSASQPVKEKAEVKEKPTAEKIFCQVMIEKRPYIGQQLLAEGNDLIKREGKISKGGFDEEYKNDKRIYNKTKEIYNALSDTQKPDEKDHPRWVELHKALYYDPATKQPYNRFTYRDSRYHIWHSITKKFNELKKKFFGDDDDNNNNNNNNNNRKGGRK